ncbi:MAG TPA: MBL fold metallo-hydrolase, partial [Thermoplasmata archaeon]|nr:MBL fold metallo-hydrolase [Thermoplasmata archaeon]
QYPRPAPVGTDALFLSHAHLDHSGMAPLLSRLPHTRVVGTAVTAAVTDLLTRDSLKVARLEGYLEPYSAHDIRALQQRFDLVDRHGTYRMKGIEVDLTSAGHIPGATMFRFRGPKDVLFSGDVQSIATHLVKPAEPVDADILFLESTYAGREHPDRADTERRLIDRIREVVARGGKAIIPAFAVGRAQEVAMAIAHAGFEVYLDGMARKVNSIYRAAPEYLLDPRGFRRALDALNIVEHATERKKALREADAVISTGGMLDGGPVLFYIGELYRDPKSAIFLTGYQVEGSNGRQLVEQGTLTIDGVTVRPECEVEAFDFSSHAGHSELVDLVKRTGAADVVLMHGDRREELAKSLREFTRVHLPENGLRFSL